jgi:hypothetical protein
MKEVTLKDKWMIAMTATPMTMIDYICVLIVGSVSAIPLLLVSIETSSLVNGVMALFFATTTGALAQSFVSFFNNPEPILLDSYIAHKKSTMNSVDEG